MSQQAVERTLGKLLTDERVKEEHPMLQRTFVAVSTAIAVVSGWSARP